MQDYGMLRRVNLYRAATHQHNNTKAEGRRDAAGDFANRENMAKFDGATAGCLPEAAFSDVVY